MQLVWSQAPASAARSRRRWAASALTAVVAAVAALLVAAINEHTGPLSRPELAPITSLPIAVYPVAALGVVAAILVRRHWWAGLPLFFAWLPFEDLVRKFTANDIRVYFVKDGLLAIALIGALPRIRDHWKGALGESLQPTQAILAFAVVMSLPSAARDPNLPFVAFHARFLYAVLLPVGAYIARDRRMLERTLLALTLLMASVSVLGIVQAVVGPTFLNPALENSPFQNLTVTKTAGDAIVLRPSATFADVSRFASWTILTVVIALCALRLASSVPRRRVAFVSVGIGLAAAFASASRAALLVAVPLASFSALSPGPGLRRLRWTTVALGVSALAIAATLGGRVGDVYHTTSDFFAETVNPFSSHFDLGPRLANYAGAIRGGIEGTNGLGAGTGTESLGKRYVGLVDIGTHTESGWGSVAAEWGLAGLATWVIWTVSWSRRATRACRTDNRPGMPAINRVLAAYLIIYLVALFSLGIGAFENYIANAFFWFLSGIVFSSGVDALRTARARRNPRYGLGNVRRHPLVVESTT